MKKYKIILFIILLSLFSWIISSYFMINYYKKIWINEKTIEKTQNSEVINEDLKVISIRNIENEITTIAKTLSSWVVSIVIKKDLTLFRSNPWWFFYTPIWTVKKKVWWWTWFFITKDWIIITNKHVISDENAEYTIITSDWKEYNAKLLAKDPLTDLAIIKIDSDEEFTTIDIIENEENIQIWQFSIAIWNALAEFQNSVSLWVISGKNRNIDVWDWTKLTWLLQTDAAINPWNSWWPLVNLNWEVIWINTAIVGNSNSLGFSIPLSKRKVEYMLESINKYSEIKKPFIWINYLILNEQIKEELWVEVNYWAYILDREWSIVKWSQAEKSWLEIGDIILTVDWININLTNDLNSIIQNKIPWDILNLNVLKSNWKKKNIKLELWINK